jgi:hypothetical protein
MLENMCMYMPYVVNSCRSIKSFIILGNRMIPGKISEVRYRCLLEYHVLVLLGFYIPGNLMISGKIPRICQSTTKCFRYTFLILFLYDNDDVISASC